MPTNPFGSFEDVFEQGVSQVKQSVKQQVSTTAQTTNSQVTGATPSNDTGGAQPDTVHGLTDQFNETSQQQSQQNQQLDPASLQATQALEAKDFEDRQKKLAEARQRLQQLHKQTYYDPTFNRPKKEPTVQEKLEHEKQEEEQKKMVELEEQKKKDEPIALSRAKRGIEMNRGASG